MILQKLSRDRDVALCLTLYLVPYIVWMNSSTTKALVRLWMHIHWSPL